MHTLFLNPFTMIAGAILVLAPIIIHLINRLRYRRVPWAAMEFLLKSLKKNRRKLILKQLLLLLLRCSFVLLAGLLLARYIGSALGVGQPRGTLHVVLLDDTASMTDAWREDGIAKSTFEVAKAALLEDIAAGAADAGTPQALELIRLTNPTDVYRIDRINAQSIDDLRVYLNGIKPTALHADFRPAVAAARSTFERDSQAKRVLHVVSDFRARDWAGPSAELLAKELPGAVEGKAGQVHLLDVAHPVRSERTQTALDHGNIGIVDLQPESRVVGPNLPVEFTVTVANYTPASRKNVRVIVRINGQERDDASTVIPEVPTGITTQTFVASFDAQATGMATVTARLPAEEAGLAIDDLRYAAVEVRDKVPILFIAADAAARGKPESEGFFLRALFLDAAKGFEVVERGPQELEQPGLERFPAIFVLDVPRLSDKAKANAEAYVRGGGGIFFSLGGQSDVDFYTRWHAEGKGLFPMPLAKATEPLPDKVRMQRMFDATPSAKAFPRADTHPIIARIYRDDTNRELNNYLHFLFVDRYVPVPRAKWNVDPGAVDELYTLPNYRALDDFKEPAQRLLLKIPVDDAKYEKYRDRLRVHQRTIKEMLAGDRPLHALAAALEAMLTEEADPNRPGTVNLQEFWGQAEQAQLRSDIQRFIESARYGDPLLVASRFGKGRVVVLATTAGNAWNDWPSGPAQPYFVMLMLEVQKHLASVGTDANRLLGSTLELSLDAAKYEPRLRRKLIREMPPDAPPTAANVDQGEMIGQAQASKLTFNFADAREPGVYRFDLTPRSDGGKDAKRTESLAYAFNVDTVAEGDLRRATRDDLTAAAPGAKLHTPGSGLARVLRDRKSDVSESPWFFLLILLVLVCEQALAVHLSYHRRGDASNAVNLATRTVS